MAKKSQKAFKPMYKGLIALALLLALTVFISCIAVNGMDLDSEGVNVLLPWVPVSNANWPVSLQRSNKLGCGYAYDLTVQGTEEDAKAAAGILVKRASYMSFNDVTAVANGTSIHLEVPEMSDADLQALLSVLTAAGKYEFSFNGTAFMTGEDIAAAGGYYNNGYYLSLVTTEEGKQKLADATAANIGSAMTITRDGATLVSATVGEAFTEGALSVSMDKDTLVSVIAQINSGAYASALTEYAGSKLSSSATCAVILIIALIVLIAAFVLALLYSKLTAVSVIWAVWCTVVLNLFLYATIIIRSAAAITFGILLAMLIGLVLAAFVSVLRARAIGEDVTAGASLRSALKTGFRRTGAKTWIVMGGVLVISIILMIIKATEAIGYTLAAGVFSAAVGIVLMRLFQYTINTVITKTGCYTKLIK